MRRLDMICSRFSVVGRYGHTSNRDSRSCAKQRPFQAQFAMLVRGVFDTALARWTAACETPSTAAAFRVDSATVRAGRPC